jgi:hypothetical protein
MILPRELNDLLTSSSREKNVQPKLLVSKNSKMFIEHTYILPRFLVMFSSSIKAKTTHVTQFMKPVIRI